MRALSCCSNVSGSTKRLTRPRASGNASHRRRRSSATTSGRSATARKRRGVFAHPDDAAAWKRLEMRGALAAVGIGETTCRKVRRRLGAAAVAGEATTQRWISSLQSLLLLPSPVLIRLSNCQLQWAFDGVAATSPRLLLWRAPVAYLHLGNCELFGTRWGRKAE